MLAANHSDMNETSGKHAMGQPDHTEQPAAVVLFLRRFTHTYSYSDPFCLLRLHDGVILSELTRVKNF